MNILVLGAGRMGYGAAFDLIHNSPDVASVTVADFDGAKAEAVAAGVGTSRISSLRLDASNYADAVKAMKGHDSVISCVNYWYNESLSKAAIETRTNFCDLGGNNYVVDAQLALNAEAKAAGINIIPDCGLAPGMVSILAMHGAAKFDRLDEIHIRVGGLPQRPEPPLDYQLVFSVEGLINEYIETARVIRDGRITEVESMTELESFSFDGFPPLEAFQTSGGTSTLPDTFLGKIKELDYKTIRYTGHCEKFKTMIDLGLCSSESLESGVWSLESEPGAIATGLPAADTETGRQRDKERANPTSGSAATASSVTITPRKVFASLLEKHLPADGPDYVLVRLEFVGTRRGHGETGDERQETGDYRHDKSAFRDPHSALDRLVYDIIDKQDETTGLSAMMRTTAFPASIIAQMMARGDVLSRGATPQEKAIDPEKFVTELLKRRIRIDMY
ncbi:MAG: saccharopine dehydrogenase NADP-binding domain-containing protein [Acidobacteria bacterium]|nr:saccharopine dehydrogenase NADP-binding domain-containing protein [Acidobacteriota bacterium]